MEETNHRSDKNQLSDLIDGLIDELNENPKDERVWVTCGMLYFLKNDFESSLDCFLVAHNLDPSDATVIFRLGMVFFKLNEWENAEIWFNKYLDVAMPLEIDWTVFYFLSLVIEKTRGLPEAIKVLEKGLERFPQKPLLLLTYAEFQFNIQNFARASEIFEKLLKIEQKQEYWYFLFRCYYELGYEDLASHSFRQFMSIDPNFRLNEDWISLLGLTVHAENYRELKEGIMKLEREILASKDLNQLEKLKSLYQGDSTSNYIEKLTEIQNFLKET
ncbi:MAG: hypothetical protein D6732_17490 [Methanobacteriota archaeon]|nr:MAG: hypothetical protein D6732_17490 [Euryarchaeota archaeon]